MVREVAESRPILRVVPSERVLEGAGVPVRRAFGSQDVPKLDPFLLLDDLRSDNPIDSLPGFPWHPHRGIETVTYMLEGRVEHEDSLGNRGIIRPGGVQWMTAGSGIIHQEMPKAVDGHVGGFQLWVNLPRGQKMENPRYRELEAPQLPIVEPQKGVEARVIAGNLGNALGAVRDLSVDVEYFDVSMKPDASFDHAIPQGHTAFAYLLEGSGAFEEGSELVTSRSLVVFGEGDRVRIRAGPRGLRFLFAAGKPLREPIAWWGPIVMNDRRQILTALQEYENGTFIKHPAPA